MYYFGIITQHYAYGWSDTMILILLIAGGHGGYVQLTNYQITIKRMITFWVFFALLLGLLGTKRVDAATIDLQQYYPNKALASNHYLEGFNYKLNPTQRSVLWFEQVINSSRVDGFRMYNSGPEDPNSRCNFDALNWDYASTKKASSAATLRYTQTRNSCNVSSVKPVTDIVYSPGISFIPRYWNDVSGWNLSGSSTATYKEGATIGQLATKCLGTNNWKAEILGRVLLDAPTGQTAIHWRSTQTTTWTSGSGSTYSGCRPGATTQWQEDYYMVDNLPVVGGGTAKGLKRSVGGNLVSNYPNWDVWMDKWQPLPAL